MAREIEYKSVPLEVKAADLENGSFEGYASRFNEKDAGDDIVMPGAFSMSLEAWKSSGRMVPVLWQHRPGEPIGDWPSLTEDKTGLFGKGSLWIDDAPYAKIARKGMLTKTITGLSMGYIPKRDEIDRKTGVRKLHEVDLVEVSVVTNPMLDSARVEAVKSALFAGKNLPTLPEFEDFLREAGFSKTQAAAIASNGLSKLLRSESDSVKAAVQAVGLLHSFQLP